VKTVRRFSLFRGKANSIAEELLSVNGRPSNRISHKFPPLDAADLGRNRREGIFSCPEGLKLNRDASITGAPWLWFDCAVEKNPGIIFLVGEVRDSGDQPDPVRDVKVRVQV
jgi:hypothetical protein